MPGWILLHGRPASACPVGVSQRDILWVNAAMASSLVPDGGGSCILVGGHSYRVIESVDRVMAIMFEAYEGKPE